MTNVFILCNLEAQIDKLNYQNYFKVVILLFLDTETTGLKPVNDQIIELGGLIVDFDTVSLKFKELSSFESTISLQKQLDEKITRLTGITIEELSTAPDLIQVQEKWLSWLDPYETKIDAIIGHSIDFDLGFLHQENWFLPKTKIIDTLDLCRIIFADLEAINLEFLVNSLNISFETTATHHRSLFDTKATFYLFKIIIDRLVALKLPQNYLDLICKNYLNLNISFYGSSNLNGLEIPTLKTNTSDTIKLALTGESLKIDTATRLKRLPAKSLLEKIDQLLNIPHNKKITTLLLQIGTSFYLKNLWPNKNYKIHLQRGLQDYWLLDFLLTFLEQDGNFVSEHFVMPRIESLIWDIKSIRQNHLELAKLVEFTEVLSQYKNSVTSLNQGTHDFLLASISPFINYGSYNYNPLTSTFEENNLVARLENMMLDLDLYQQELQNSTAKISITKDSTNTFVSFLQKFILKLIEGFNWDKNHKIQITTFNNLLTLSVEKPGFQLNQHFLNLKSQFPNLTFESYLPPELLSRMKIILNLDLPVESVTDEVEFDFVDKVELSSFIEEKLFLASESNKPVIILAGINSTLKELKNCALNSDKAGKYLILGENGSMTKITSKIIHGFSGVVILKTNNLEQLLKTLDSSKFAEIILVNQPYFFVDDYWKNVYKLLGFDYYSGDKELKYLYLKSLQYYYYKVYGIFLTFVRGY